MKMARRPLNTCDVQIVRDGTIPVAPLPLKSGWSVYRSGIESADVAGVSSVVVVSDEAACAAEYISADPIIAPWPCTTSVMYVRAKTPTAASVTLIPILFSSLGGAGCFPWNQSSITLAATATKDGDNFLTEWAQIDVGPDDQAHFLVSSLGGAGSVTIEARNG